MSGGQRLDLRGLILGYPDLVTMIGRYVQDDFYAIHIFTITRETMLACSLLLRELCEGLRLVRVYEEVLIDKHIREVEDAELERSIRRDLHRWERDVEQPHWAQTWFGHSRGSEDQSHSSSTYGSVSESTPENPEYDTLVQEVETMDEPEYMLWRQNLTRTIVGAHRSGQATDAHWELVRRLVVANRGVQPIG